MKRRSPAVCLAFSGGLDTTYCALLLREQGYRVHAVTVDTGGFSRSEMRTIAARAKAAGVERYVMLDGRSEVFERYALPLLFGNVLRGGVYPLSVAAERAVQVQAVARYARRMGARAIAHGSTAAGNDQFRFDAGLRVLVPGVEVLAPVRDNGVSRQDETAYCESHGIKIAAKTTRYSVNEGLWGTTIGGGETHDPWELPPETLYPGRTLARAPRASRTAVVGFRGGRPVSLDGRRLSGLELVAKLNALGRLYAAGRAVHLGDTILGSKGRIVFEAPAALALIAAHAELEKLVMTKEQRQLKARVAETYGRLLHEGLAFEPALSDAAAYLRATQSRVTGEARLRFAPGRFDVIGVRSRYSLLRSSVVRYGEANAYLSPEEARGVGKTLALPGRLWTLAGQAGRTR
ncbi:MAG TPA: argininosuccinate synthase [Thermoanaerobaculia bacterium]|nr:argininosuccinate synthase [Thermoanaerobaculia bacterium]